MFKKKFKFAQYLLLAARLRQPLNR